MISLRTRKSTNPLVPHAQRFIYPLIGAPEGAPVRVLHPDVLERAARVVDQRRPHCLRDGKLVAWYVTHPQDAVNLAMHCIENISVPVGFDFETRNWSPKMKVATMEGGKKIHRPSPLHPNCRAEPVMFQICWGKDSYCIAGELLYFFQEWIQRFAKLDITNVSFESAVCKNMGMPLPRFHRDTVQMDFLLEETARQGAHGLKDCARDYLGIHATSFEAVFQDRSFEEALRDDPELALSYAAADPYLTTFVADVQSHLLAQRDAREGADYDYETFYYRWERPYQNALIHMEQGGVGIDHEAIEKHKKSTQAEIDKLDAQAYKIVGRPINLSSPKQLSEYYFAEKGFRPRQTTNGFYCLLCQKNISEATDNLCSAHGKGALVNRPTTDDATLSIFAQEGDPLAKIIQRRRTVIKNRGTWVNAYFMDSDGLGFSWPPINGALVVSGRLSGSHWLTTPQEFRDILTALPGERIIGVDYSQLELRLLGHISGDETIAKAYKEGKDLHTFVAAKVEVFKGYGAEAIKDDEIVEKVYVQIRAAVDKADLLDDAKVKQAAGDFLDDEHKQVIIQGMTEEEKRLKGERKKAKAVNFGIIYGKSAGALANDLGCPVAEAEELYETVWSVYPEAREHFREKIERVKQTGELKTILGRRRKIFELFSDDPYLRGKGRRLVQNQPEQAGGADVIRAAMIQCDLDLEAGGVYGTIGQGAFGHWDGGEYVVDWDRLPPEWEAQPPPALMAKIGELGRLQCRPFLQVHDELDFRCPEQNVEAAKARIVDLMEDPFGPAIPLRVSMVADSKVGRTLLEVK